MPAAPALRPASTMPLDVAEVAGHERQHARREEREQAGGERDRQREPQPAADDGLAGIHAAPLTCSASRSSIIAATTDGLWIALVNRAATRPSRVEQIGGRRRRRRRRRREGELHGVVADVEDRRVGDAVLLREAAARSPRRRGCSRRRTPRPRRRTRRTGRSRSAASARHGPQPAYQKLTSTTWPARSSLESGVAGRRSRRRRRSARRARRPARSGCVPSPETYSPLPGSYVGRDARRAAAREQERDGQRRPRGGASLTPPPGRWIRRATLSRVPDSRPRRTGPRRRAIVVMLESAQRRRRGSCASGLPLHACGRPSRSAAGGSR